MCYVCFSLALVTYTPWNVVVLEMQFLLHMYVRLLHIFYYTVYLKVHRCIRDGHGTKDVCVCAL